MASIELRTRPPGGVAFLDGRRLSGVTPMKITQITPGRHRLEVHKSPGYNPWIHEFEIQPDQTLKLHQKLLPLQVSVRVSSEPHGTAFIVRDGQRERLGATPIDIKLNPKFSYQVAIERSGYQTWTQPIQFDGDTPVSIEAKLERVSGGSAVASLPGADDQPTPRAKAQRRPPRPQTPRVAAVERPQPRPPDRQPQATEYGLLHVNSRPWTRIAIDGKDTGMNTPQLGIRLPVGRHQVTLSNTKFNINETFSVTIRADQPMRLIKKFLK